VSQSEERNPAQAQGIAVTKTASHLRQQGESDMASEQLQKISKPSSPV